MRSAAIQKIELMKELSLIPTEKYKDIKGIFDKILTQSRTAKPKIMNLRGIWKDIGFEKITDIESELKNARKEIKDAVLKRRY